MENNAQPVPVATPPQPSGIQNVTPMTPAGGTGAAAPVATGPTPQDPAAPQNTNPTAPPAEAEGKKKILVVDDEADARELFAELIRTRPEYWVEVANDGDDALRKCEAMNYDLVLLDIVMPNLDGVDTLKQIKEAPDRYGNPIVIMLTNIGGDIAIQEAIKLGAVGYKLKIDTEPEELLATIDKAFSVPAGQVNQAVIS